MAASNKKRKIFPFTLSRSKKNMQFFFTFKAGNGECTGQSEMYKQKQGAFVGIRAVINVLLEIVFEKGFVNKRSIKDYVVKHTISSAKTLKGIEAVGEIPFHIYRSVDKQWYFVLRAKNHETLLTSETYTSLDSAYTGIISMVNTIAECTDSWDSDGEWSNDKNLIFNYQKILTKDKTILSTKN